MSDPHERAPDPAPRPRRTSIAPDGRETQEFVAGAHPVDKELVVRMDDGRRLLMLAVDESRQRRLGELFERTRPGAADGATDVTMEWRVLEISGRPLAVRLDLAFRLPIRCRVHLLFSLEDSVVVRHAAGASHLCLLSSAAFARLERTGVCGEHAIVLPAPPARELEAAIAA